MSRKDMFLFGTGMALSMALGYMVAGIKDKIITKCIIDEMA